MPKKLTKEQFTEKANFVHFNKYDYSKFEYVNSDTKGIVICQTHGEFFIDPYHHINRKQGCPKCARKNLSIKELIEKAKTIHNNKYDYSKFKYIKSSIKGIIICPIHGEFSMDFCHHINRKQGCPKCSGRNKTLEEWKNKAAKLHDNKYNYFFVNDISTKPSNKVKIICPVHGEFFQNPHKHLCGDGCPACARKNLTKEDWISRFKKFHGEKYCYDFAEIVNAKTKIKIICPIHGEFFQLPDNHLKYGCKECGKKALGEELTKKILLENKIFFETQYSFEELKNPKTNSLLYFDFYIPSKNLLLEIDGEGHRKPTCFGGISKEEAKLNFEKQSFRDKLKDNYCKNKNIKLVRIPYFHGNLKKLEKDLQEILSEII